MRILVTGSEGNIGRRLVPYLKAKGHNVCRCDIFQVREDDFLIVDINSCIGIWKAFNKFNPEVVYHLAAVVGRASCEDIHTNSVNVNISGTNNIIQACKEFNSKLIYFSTSEVYGNTKGILPETSLCVKQINRYGLSKYLGEKLIEYEVENNGLKALIIRPFLFYDEKEVTSNHCSTIMQFAEKLTHNQEITVFKGAKRSWMYMSDVVDVFERLCNVDDFKIFNIGHPEVYDVIAVANIMCQIVDANPSKLIKEIDLPGQMSLEKIPCLDNQQKILHFTPKVDLMTGILRVINTIQQKQ